MSRASVKRGRGADGRALAVLTAVLGLACLALLLTGLFSHVAAQAPASEGAAASVADTATTTTGSGRVQVQATILLLFTFLIAVFLGVELITKVPSQLHTPLMSGSNAISGITIVGALIAAGQGADSWVLRIVGVIAMVCAMINVAGGYLVTNRMLRMFKGREGSKQ